jgi:RNA polymerase sigma-70 factor (ECF subfamily)
MNDLQAIRRVLDGDREAFSELVEEHHGVCLRYAVRMLGSREDAEDAVQESMIRAYRGLARYDHRDRFRAWLFRILINRCRTVIARRKSRDGRMFAIEEAPARLLATAPPDIDPMGREVLERAVAMIDPLQREAFLLKYVEEMSYPEMSACTGEGVSALKMRVKRAREALQAILKEAMVVL